MSRAEKLGRIAPEGAHRKAKVSVHGVKWKAADTPSETLGESGMESLWTIFLRLLELRDWD